MEARFFNLESSNLENKNTSDPDFKIYIAVLY